MKPIEYVPKPCAHAKSFLAIVARIVIDQLIRHRDFTEYLVAGMITAMLVSWIPWIGQLWPLLILIGALMGLIREFRNH
jgi:hypothetical protein